MRYTNGCYLKFGNTLCSQVTQQFVPKHEPVLQKDIKLLENFLISKPNTLVLTGAGISTESGNLT